MTSTAVLFLISSIIGMMIAAMIRSEQAAMIPIVFLLILNPLLAYSSECSSAATRSPVLLMSFLLDPSFLVGVIFIFKIYSQSVINPSLQIPNTKQKSLDGFSFFLSLVLGKVYIAKIRFIIKIIGGVMKGTNLRSISYYQAELASNYEKYRKVAELQTRLVLNDRTNHQLADQIELLKRENRQLRQQIQAKDMVDVIQVKSHKKSALDRVNSLLDNLTSKSEMRAYQPLSSKFCQVQLPTRVASFFQRPKADAKEHQETAVRLDKNVYMEPAVCDKTRKMNKKEEQKDELKFPAQLNQSLGKRAQSTFQLQEYPLQESREQNIDKSKREDKSHRDENHHQQEKQPQARMNHWSSSQAFGFGSDLLQNAKSCDIRRRKTFLSVGLRRH